jgi:hypothetical protein
MGWQVNAVTVAFSKQPQGSGDWYVPVVKQVGLELKENCTVCESPSEKAGIVKLYGDEAGAGIDINCTDPPVASFTEVTIKFPNPAPLK